MRNILLHGNDIGSMMKVVGEEGTSLEDFIVYLKEEMLDAVYLQQNSFDLIEANCGPERQRYVIDKLIRVLGSEYALKDKMRPAVSLTVCARNLLTGIIRNL